MTESEWKLGDGDRVGAGCCAPGRTLASMLACTAGGDDEGGRGGNEANDSRELDDCKGGCVEFGCACCTEEGGCGDSSGGVGGPILSLEAGLGGKLGGMGSRAAGIVADTATGGTLLLLDRL